MSERGFFAVDRGVWDHPIFADEPFSEREAFLWLVGEAAFKPRRARVGSVVFELDRGQLAASLRFMAAKWHWSEARVRRYLARLKKDEMIDAKTDAGATQLTICNYDRYQAGLNEADAEATQERRKKKNKETIKQETTEAEASVLSDFAELWDALPKRKGTNSRKNAEARYISARKARIDPVAILEGAKRYAAHCFATGKAGTEMVKTAEAWINGHLWESDYSPGQQRAGPPQRMTFGQLAREAAQTLAGQPHEPQPHRQAEFFDGPSLDLVAGDAGADIVDLQSRRSAGAAW